MHQQKPNNFTQILIPFLKSGIKVLNELTGVKFEKKEVYQHTGNKSIGEIKIEIEVIGDIKTKVYFDMSKTFAYKLAKHILQMNTDDDNDTELMESAIHEVGNMIAGNATGFLEDMNLDCDIKTPKAILGKDVEIFTPNTQIGVIEFTGPIGDFNIYIVIHEEERFLDPAGILLYNIPDVISNFIVEFFIPRGFSVYSCNNEEDAWKMFDHKEIVLVFINYNQRFDHESMLSKWLNKVPNLRIIFYSSPTEWSDKMLKKFPNTVLGYIPRAFDSLKTAKAIILILDKIGIKYNQKRKHVRVELRGDDKSVAILYRKIHLEDEKDIINANILDLSIGGALLEIPTQQIDNFPEKLVIPRCQLNLRGHVIRTKAQIMKKIDNKLGISFIEITEDDVKRISFFIHSKLAEIVKR
ncbi:MAG: hypothetical protein A2Y41_01740 [Spirochaetes bacterium GWB1_36_13]|nr:MAG: hypothetical protein A2Y41_01740 [Spirochaetes bacterium GWB1_36_13]